MLTYIYPPGDFSPSTRLVQVSGSSSTGTGTGTGADAEGVAGILEVSGSSTWGTVCDDGFTDIDARVACFELGFSRGLAIEPSEAGFTGDFDDDPIVLDDVACTGVEPELAECPGKRGQTAHNCNPNENVAVMCDNWETLSDELSTGMCCCSYYERDEFAK